MAEHKFNDQKLLIDATAMYDVLEKIAGRKPSQDAAATAFYRCRSDAKKVLAQVNEHRLPELPSSSSTE